MKDKEECVEIKCKCLRCNPVCFDDIRYTFSYEEKMYLLALPCTKLLNRTIGLDPIQRLAKEVNNER